MGRKSDARKFDENMVVTQKKSGENEMSKEELECKRLIFCLFFFLSPTFKVHCSLLLKPSRAGPNAGVGLRVATNDLLSNHLRRRNMGWCG